MKFKKEKKKNNLPTHDNSIHRYLSSSMLSSCLDCHCSTFSNYSFVKSTYCLRRRFCENCTNRAYCLLCRHYHFHLQQHLATLYDHCFVVENLLRTCAGYHLTFCLTYPATCSRLSHNRNTLVWHTETMSRSTL